VAEQLLVRTPGARAGWLHFVRFARPAAPVRAGAAPTDRGPKNLDVHCHDLPARYASLTDAGYAFRSAVSEYEVGDIRAREVQMPAHDDTNVVLVEVVGDSGPAGPAGVAALTSLVVIVPDAPAEQRFFETAFGFAEVMHHRITGPGIEQAVGLPPGSALDMRLAGDPDEPFGRLELIQYEGPDGADRFARARPPATGALYAGIAVANVAATLERAQAGGARVRAVDHAGTLFGSGPMGMVTSPAGLRIAVFAADR